MPKVTFESQVNAVKAKLPEGDFENAEQITTALSQVKASYEALGADYHIDVLTYAESKARDLNFSNLKDFTIALYDYLKEQTSRKAFYLVEPLAIKIQGVSAEAVADFHQKTRERENSIAARTVHSASGSFAFFPGEEEQIPDPIPQSDDAQVLAYKAEIEDAAPGLAQRCQIL